ECVDTDRRDRPCAKEGDEDRRSGAARLRVSIPRRLGAEDGVALLPGLADVVGWTVGAADCGVVAIECAREPRKRDWRNDEETNPALFRSDHTLADRRRVRARHASDGNGHA